jgi:hypothetical protein
MKLLRYGAAGAEKPGLLDPEGHIRDLSAVLRDIDGFALSPASLKMLASYDWKTLPKVEGTPRIGPCVARPVNFVCIGLNFADHAAETGAAIPKEPIVFLKSLGAYSGPNDPVVIPRGSKKTDWEVELGVVIGTTARYVPEHAAMDHVAGYCVCNDVSEREFQAERGGTWDKGKGCDTFGPTGPWMVTKVDRRSAGPGHVAGCGWQAHAERQHEDDDLRREAPRELREPLHHAARRRHHQHRHAAGRRPGHQARAGVPEGRPDDAPGRAWPGRADAACGCR